MTGEEHYSEAERLLTPTYEERHYSAEHLRLRVGRAQAHATLALASAIERGTRYATGMDTGGYGSPNPDPRWAAR